MTDKVKPAEVAPPVGEGSGSKSGVGTRKKVGELRAEIDAALDVVTSSTEHGVLARSARWPPAWRDLGVK